MFKSNDNMPAHSQAYTHTCMHAYIQTWKQKQTPVRLFLNFQAKQMFYISKQNEIYF